MISALMHFIRDSYEVRDGGIVRFGHEWLWWSAPMILTGSQKCHIIVLTFTWVEYRYCCHDHTAE